MHGDADLGQCGSGGRSEVNGGRRFLDGGLVLMVCRYQTWSFRFGDLFIHRSCFWDRYGYVGFNNS